MRKLIRLIFALLLIFPVTWSKGHSSGSHRSSSSSQHKKPVQVRSYAKRHGANVRPNDRSRSGRGSGRSAGVTRDNHGRIKRSSSAKHNFMHSHPRPSTGKKSGPCPGYVVDHIKPLAKGGLDSPSNMQWQTTAAAKEKDKWERK